MKPLAAFRLLAATLFHRSHVEAEMDEELRSHVESRADDLERSGLPRAEAERRARIEFGGHERFKEECREERDGFWLETLWTDVRHGLRMLRKNPGFTAATVMIKPPTFPKGYDNGGNVAHSPAVTVTVSN